MDTIIEKIKAIKKSAQTMESISLGDFDELMKEFHELLEMTENVQSELAEYSLKTSNRINILGRENSELKHDIDQNATHYEERIADLKEKVSRTNKHNHDLKLNLEEAENLILQQAKFLVKYTEKRFSEF